MVAGSWAILQSRASTSAIGFVFLPTMGAVTGLLGLGFAVSRRADLPMFRWLGRAALLGAGAIAVSMITSGQRTIAHNARRDADQRERDERLAAYRLSLDTLVVRSGERAADTVQALVRSRRDDREFLLAALERPLLSPPLLDSLARSPDLGVALQAIRNPATSATTLTWIYRSHANRDYFLQALAGHPNTPPTLLREIRRLDPAPILGLDIWFAENPATPEDMLLDIAAHSESRDVALRLLARAAPTCALVDAVARGPAVRAHAGDRPLTEAVAEVRARVCGRGDTTTG